MIKLDHLVYILSEVNEKLRWKALEARAWAAVIATALYTLSIGIGDISGYSAWVQTIMGVSALFIYTALFIMCYNATN